MSSPTRSPTTLDRPWGDIGGRESWSRPGTPRRVRVSGGRGPGGAGPDPGRGFSEDMDTDLG